MVSYFKDRSVQAVLLAVIICFAIHAFFLVTPPAISTTPEDGLMYYLLSPFSKLPAMILTIFYFTVVIAQAVRLNEMLNFNRMFQKPGFTAALAYILLTALWPPCNNITAALIVNSMLIWLFFRFAKLYNAKQPKAFVYNIGLITGAALLLYYPAAGLLPVVFIALGVTRPFRLNEWLVMLLGIITPLYFWGCYLFLTDQLYTLNTVAALFKWHGVTGPVKTMAVAFGGAGLLLFAGIVRWQANNTMLIQVRKIWSVVFIMLVCMLPGAFIIINAWPYALLLACVPASAVAANAFLYTKGVISSILFWVVLAVIVYVNWAAP